MCGLVVIIAVRIVVVCVCLRRDLPYQVEEREQVIQIRVDEVPVQTDALDREKVLRVEVATHRAKQRPG